MSRQTLSDYAIGYDSACLITTKGGSIKQKKLVNDVIFWTLSKLLSKKLTDNIYIEIVFQKQFYKDYGCVMWEDNNINPRDFVMELNTGLSDRQLVSTTIHECVHIKQFALGELKDYVRKPDYSVWKNKMYKVAGKDSIEYQDHPWEKEAYRLERKLFRLLKKELDIKFTRKGDII